MDRMDIQVEVPQISYEDLTADAGEESSDKIRARVVAAREIQDNRFKDASCFSNSDMDPDLVKRHCSLDNDAGRTLEQAMNMFSLSARAYASILKTARTIADLAGSTRILRPHVLEAVQYKTLDRQDDAMP